MMRNGKWKSRFAFTAALALMMSCSPGFSAEELPGQAVSITAPGSTQEEVLSGGAGEEVTVIDDSTKQQIDEILASMTLQEKVAQLFVISPEALTGENDVTQAGETTGVSFDRYPVGGIVYMESNLLSWDQVSSMLSSMQAFSESRIALPALLAVDEEGGEVRRLSGRIEGVPEVPQMRQIGDTKDPLEAYQAGSSIGDYLSQLGFNVNFAPVADVLTNPDNTVIGSRSFGKDPERVADMVAMEVQGLQEMGVCATLKHFPGHGGTSEDSHLETAVSEKTLEELRGCELIPFERGIAAGADLVMAGHVSFPNITGDYTPASLSSYFLTDLLRKEMGFEGVILTDALSMRAVTNLYSSGEAAVQAFLAGADLLLMPADFQSAYAAVMNEIGAGRISEERLNESLRRIIGLKLRIRERSILIYQGDPAGGSDRQLLQDSDGIQQVPYPEGDISVEEGFDGLLIEG